MKPAKHVIVSFTIGSIFYLYTKNIYTGFLCFFSGTLVDVDHVIEYVIHRGIKNITIDKVWRVSEETAKKGANGGFKKLYLIFHSWEIFIFLWLLTVLFKNIYILALTLGYSSHIMLDVIGNRMYPQGYSFIWRRLKKFNTKNLLREKL